MAKLYMPGFKFVRVVLQYEHTDRSETREITLSPEHGDDQRSLAAAAEIVAQVIDWSVVKRAVPAARTSDRATDSREGT